MASILDAADDASSSSPKPRADAAPSQLQGDPKEQVDIPSAKRSSQYDQNKTADAHSSLSTLEDELSSLSLDNNTMFRALASIFQATQIHESHLDIDHLKDGRDTWAILRHGDELERQGIQDLTSLAAVRETLEKMLGVASRLLLPAIRIIADGSREVSWRRPFGESGILEFALRVIASDKAPEDIQIQCLRLVGNACADTDENRERVVSKNYLPIILRKVSDPQLVTVAVPVLYNTCCEYEPAQEQAVKGGLYTTLIATIETGTLDSSPALGYLCRLLDLGSKHLDASDSPENAVELLLQCATRPGLDVDDSVSLVDSAVAHLQLEQFQKHMVEQDLFGVPLRYLVRSYFPKALLSGTRLPSLDSSSSSTSRDPDDEAELSRVRKALIQSLSDISALSEFLDRHASLSTPLVDSLSSWLLAALPHIQLCSCIVLGNLARGDQICEAMVSRLAIHKDLISMIRSGSDTAVLHAALGFLRNLALPPENKTILGESGLVDALTRFWTSDFMPQIAHAAAAIGRQLVIGCLPNVERLMTPLSSDPDSPAHDRTYISLLLSLFERSDEVAVKMEIARTIAGIIRCINSISSISSDSRDGILDSLYDRHQIMALPLSTMVTQTQYPVIRSEGWFSLALMSRHSKGAILISGIITEVNAFTALEAAISGRVPESGSSSSATPMTDPDAPISSAGAAQSEEMMAKDRDNALILVNELLQHLDHNLLSDIRRSTLEELLQTGPQT